MGVGAAHPRRKNLTTLKAVVLLITNFCMASKTFFKLKQYRPATYAHEEISHFKTCLEMANQLIAILERHLRFLGLRKTMDIETF